MQSQHSQQKAQDTITNFDLSSLHMLRNEIEVTLSDAESHLGEFADDSSQASLLLDSVDSLTQVTAIFRLIHLTGASELSDQLSIAFQRLHDEGSNKDSEMIMTVSEGIMILSRYVEFVLLKQTIEPTLLLPIINRLRDELGQTQLTEKYFDSHNFDNITIANPDQNFMALDEVISQADDSRYSKNQLIQAYRTGLKVALNKTDNQLTQDEQLHLAMMQASCGYIAELTDSLFWQAAAAVVTDIASILPLGIVQKKSLIYVEQQMHGFLSSHDSRFADLVSFACQRDHIKAQSIRKEFASNALTDAQKTQMQTFLLGPNFEVIDTVNRLLQNEISQIKDTVDAAAREPVADPQRLKHIAFMLRHLALRFHLLNLSDASKAVISQARAVVKWKTPTPADFDDLLGNLQIAENAAVNLSKSYSPGSVNLPLNNHNISMHQIDTAYHALIQESRATLATAERGINNYLNDPYHDKAHIANIPAMLHAISGAVLFLNVPNGYTLMKRAADYLESELGMANVELTEFHFNRLADSLMAVDYYLESLEVGKPIGNKPMTIGNQSLQELLAA